MKKTKDQVYEYIQKRIFTDATADAGISTTEIAEALNMQRSNVSALLNELLKEDRLVKTNTRPVLYQLPKAKGHSDLEDSFRKMIGANESLRKPIQLAKAAILYPGASLNMLLRAQPGCGTTFFASRIYEFAKDRGVIGKDAPYIKVNCAHFSKSSNTLNHVLFADDCDFGESAFFKAQGGVLFVDSVELMDATQESRLFHFIESHEVVSQFDGKTYSCGNCIFVIGTQLISGVSATEYNVPMTIDLPSLEVRPLGERFSLIDIFFSEEAMNLKCDIEVTREAVVSLMLARFDRNIKEMKMEIKSACANAYVRMLEEPENTLRVVINDFGEVVSRHVTHVGDESPVISELTKLVGNPNHFTFSQNGRGQQSQSPASSMDNMYGDIKKQYEGLADRGVSQQDIRFVINNYIDNLLSHYRIYVRRRSRQANVEQLSKIAAPEVVELVLWFAEEVTVELGRDLGTDVIYGLCLHLNTLYNKRRAAGKVVPESQVQETIAKYPQEYTCSVRFAGALKEQLNMELDIEEIVIVTLFIAQKEEMKECPVVLYCMHGNGVAKALADNTNAITCADNCFGFDLDLSMTSAEAIDALEKTVLQIDRGGGIIAIYDMGSFATMLDIVSDRTNIKIRSMMLPLTLTGIELSRNCVRESNIDHVYNTVQRELAQMFGKREKMKSAIITLCRTSEGGAMEMKKRIDSYSKLGMRVIPLSILSKQSLAKELVELRKTYNIHAIVGTFDPNLFGIPFIPISAIFECDVKDLDHILMFEPVKCEQVDFEMLYKRLEGDLSSLSLTEVKKTIPAIVTQWGDAYGLDGDERIGMFIHLITLLDCLVSGNKGNAQVSARKYVREYPEDYSLILPQIKKLEKRFGVILSDSEVGVILATLKKLS